MQGPQRLNGTVGLNRGLGISTGGGQGHPLQYSCLENPMEEPVGLWDHQELHMTEVTQHTHTEKAVWRILKKLKIEIPYDLAIPYLGVYPKEMKTLTEKHIGNPMLTEALFIMTKTWKHPQYPPTDE